MVGAPRWITRMNASFDVLGKWAKSGAVLGTALAAVMD